jgi:trigger factor
MKTELKDISATQKELKIEIDAESVKNTYNKVSQKYARAVTVPGFRKGFAPIDVVRMRYKEEIKNEVLRELLPDKVTEAIQSHDLNPLGEPELHLEDSENLKVNGSQSISLHVHVEVMPEIPTPDYKGIEATRRVRPVEDKEIDRVIDERRQQGSTLIPVEGRKSQTGDTVIIDLEGVFVGKPEEDPINAEDIEIIIGDDRIEKSFSENLAGLDEDEEKEFTVEYAEDFAAPLLAGQKVNYKAKVKSVGVVEIPEADDEWATSLDEGYESIKDLRAKLRNDLELNAKNEADNRVRDELVTKLIDSQDFEVPKALIDLQARNLLNNFAQDLERQGMDLKKLEQDFIQMAFEQMRGQAERDVRGAMLLEKVAELEKVEVSSEEIAEEIDKMAQYYSVGAEQIRASLLQQEGGENGIADRLRSRKAVEVLVAKSKVKDGEWIDESQAQNQPETEEKADEKKPKASKKKAEKTESAKEEKDSAPKKKKSKTAE